MTVTHSSSGVPPNPSNSPVPRRYEFTECFSTSKTDKNNKQQLPDKVPRASSGSTTRDSSIPEGQGHETEDDYNEDPPPDFLAISESDINDGKSDKKEVDREEVGAIAHEFEEYGIWGAWRVMTQMMLELRASVLHISLSK